jgi:restriction endonuclease S subunit
MAEELQKYLVDGMREIRELVTENNAEIRELKGELKEFKKHVLGRVEKLENNEGKRRNERYSTISILIATGALLVNIVGKFLP